MFVSNDQFEQAGGAAPASARSASSRNALVLTTDLTFSEKLRAGLARIDWTPDLGARIGSRDWFRGFATCTGLIAFTLALSPGFASPLPETGAPTLTGKTWDNQRAQGIAPLAWGADSGQRMAANDSVRPLGETPDRPIQLASGAIGEGETLAGTLIRAGAAKGDVARISSMVSAVLPLDTIRPGTRFDMTLGRREHKSDPRPLEQLSFQPAFDFRLTVSRGADGTLAIQRQVIAVDDTPLRVQGLVGQSIFKSMRAAGVPAKVAADYLKAVATRVSIGGDVTPNDRWDIMLSQRRAATGEVELGSILYAGLDLSGAKKVQLVKWSRADSDGDAEKGAWYDASGQTERTGFMGLPVAGRISSTFGMRMHPILGYFRMHKGMDVACAYGSPVYAVIDGTVNWAGYKGGYGQFVGIAGPGFGTGYGHLSRVLVRNGERVTRGQIVAYSGNSGLSTGPHLHFEVYRGGETVNPRGFSFSSVAALTGSMLKAFKAHVAELMETRVGAAAARK